MNKKEKLNKLLQTVNYFKSFNPNGYITEGYSTEDILYLSKEKIMNASLNLILDIIKLIDEGYNEEEILSMIENINFEEELNFDEDEKQFLKKDAAKSLKKILKNKNKGEDIYE